MKPGDPFFVYALEAGGSHYPEVGGDNLRLYGQLIVQECARLAREVGDMETNSRILEHFKLING